jgi:hypothetical protein
MISRSDVRPIGDLLVCCLGPAVWAAHLFVMYAAETLVCTGAWAGARDLHFLLIAAGATAVALAMLLGLIVRRIGFAAAHRQAGLPVDASSSFLHDASLMLALLAMLGVLWVALPAALVTGCPSPTR